MHSQTLTVSHCIADTTIVATLSASISTSFSSFNNLSWLGTSYLVASAATQPLAGRLTDIYGRRAGFLVSGAAFGLGTFLCGIAPREWVFLLGRAIAGAGGGATMAICTFVGADLIPLRKRGVVQGINHIVLGCGAGLGGLLGGLMNDTLGWKAAFLIQLPPVVLGFIFCAKARDIPSRDARKRGQGKIDYQGSTALVSAIVLLLVGLNSGGNQVSWGHPLVLGTVGTSVALFSVFVFIEIRVASEPLVPLRLMASRRTIWAACLVYFFSHVAMFGMMYYVPIYVQLRGGDATRAGLVFISHSVGSAVAALSSGLLIKATGTYVYISAPAQSLLMGATVVAATFSWDSPTWAPFVCFGMMGLGMGGILVTTLTAIISSVDQHEHAVVTSGALAFRAIGSIVGVSVASVIFQNVLRPKLLAGLGDAADELIEQITQDFDAIWDLDPEIRQVIERGYMESLHAVFLAMLAMGILSLLCSLLYKQNKLHSTLSRK